MYTFFVFLIILMLINESKLICPVWIGEAGHNYNIKERFDAVRKDSNKLTVTHVHSRSKSSEKDDIYDYTLTFCGDEGTNAVLQEDASKNKKSIGKIDNSSILVGGEDILLLMYHHGDPYHSNGHCNGISRNAWVILRCEDQGEKPVFKVVEEGRYKGVLLTETPCYYLFEYNHPGACSNFVKPIKLSPGAIFCIIFIGIAAAYLVFGIIYKRFVLGAKGFEQIPNFAFWRKIGNASADGCDFVCRRQEEVSAYKGMTNALDIESNDREIDEGLLPM
ncbi:cation-dependent mannose-6-phosphate receptor isoform X1 [Hydra vulgaris]|uniref:cation-dependent mannose-6-phosphate receptor isoform X1 n=1 Tax=Hydra vulgaris TaxID=6087 RepID=UPI001F5F4DD0|nr:cation-dependent mannose-6-phosphate receptor-like [Hydra vulgaris]